MVDQQKTIEDFLESTILWQRRIDPRGWRKPKIYTAAFKKFLEQDKHRESILAEIQQILERWFIKGVTYSENSVDASLAGVPAYRLPLEVYNALDGVQGHIALNLLRWKRVPIRLWHEVLMDTSASPIQDGSEQRATFEDFIANPKGPAVWLMRDTRNMDIKRRARLVAENFYELHAIRLLHKIEALNEKAKTLEAVTSFAAVEKYMDLEKDLSDMGLGPIDLVEYYAVEASYLPTEIATMLRGLGIDKSPQRISYVHREIKSKLPDEKLKWNLKQFLIKVKGA